MATNKKTTEKLSATNLKNTLWNTLQGVKDGSIQYTDADAIASQARSIIGVCKVQVSIAQASNRGLPQELINFSESK
jgi:ABC-type Fe3+-citrate transport system substrate-binding protein